MRAELGRRMWPLAVMVLVSVILLASSGLWLAAAILLVGSAAAVWAGVKVGTWLADRYRS